MLQNQAINREFLDQRPGATLVEFGATWCGHCQAAQASISAAIHAYPHIHHIKIEDGKGQRLGRTYAVKLWPTLIFLQDGVEVERLVRPLNEQYITAALAKLK
nr:thioredoxin family protein [uncultured Methylotenera sp.]